METDWFTFVSTVPGNIRSDIFQDCILKKQMYNFLVGSHFDEITINYEDATISFFSLIDTKMAELFTGPFHIVLA